MIYSAWKQDYVIWNLILQSEVWKRSSPQMAHSGKNGDLLLEVLQVANRGREA